MTPEQRIEKPDIILPSLPVPLENHLPGRTARPLLCADFRLSGLITISNFFT
jgi:hypothetical protein